MNSEGHTGRGLLARNSIINLIGQLLPMAAGVLTIPYIVRGLGTDGYGILSIAFMVLGYFSIFDLGLSRATVKFVAEHLTPEKISRVPELVWTSLSLLIGLGVIAGAAAAALVPIAVTHLLKMPPSFAGQARTALFLLCASMPIMLGNDALRGVLEATQHFDLVNTVKVPGSICFYLFAAAAIPFGIRVPGIVLILIAIRLCTACIYLAMCCRVIPGLLSKAALSWNAVRPLASFGGWVMVSNITGPIFGNIERFLIASLLSVSALTYYSVPFDLVGKITIFPSSIAPTLFPYFSFHGTGSRNVSDMTTRSMKYLLLLLTPITAVFVFFAKDILQLWLGSQFAAKSAVVLQITAVMFFINSFAYIPYTSVQALGRPHLKAILDVVALPIYALSCWWLMRRMGINGAALARLLITVFDCTMLHLFAWQMKSFSLRDCISGPLLRAFVASGALLSMIAAIHALHMDLVRSLLLVIVAVAAYLLVFWSQAVDAQERLTFKQLWREHTAFLRHEAPQSA